jgi:putative SOS response-associated peptidase YedK
MCGRFSITKQEEEIEKCFGAKFYSEKYEPAYNACPSQFLPLISNENKEQIQLFRWGLSYSWSKLILINSRADKLKNSNIYKKLIQEKRCLIPADGFYEWKILSQSSPKTKKPYRIHMKNEALFAFAGIWDMCKNGDQNPVPAFSIITVTPNTLIADIHNRMPAILRKEDHEAWLDDQAETEEYLSLLQPYPANEMEAYEISSLLNNPQNNFPEIILPLAKQ